MFFHSVGFERIFFLIKQKEKLTGRGEFKLKKIEFDNFG